MLFGALGILLGFALVVFVAAARPGPVVLICFSAAFLASQALIPPGSLPDPVWAAITVLAAAGTLLWRPDLGFLAGVAGGAAAYIWIVVLVSQSVPFWLGVTTVMLISAVVYALRSIRPRFVTPLLIEEALVICVVFSLVLACWPAVTSGYRSAAVFTAERIVAPPTASAPWALQLSLCLLILGGLYAIWKRK